MPSGLWVYQVAMGAIIRLRLELPFGTPLYAPKRGFGTISYARPRGERRKSQVWHEIGGFSGRFRPESRVWHENGAFFRAKPAIRRENACQMRDSSRAGREKGRFSCQSRDSRAGSRASCGSRVTARACSANRKAPVATLSTRRFGPRQTCSPRRLHRQHIPYNLDNSSSH